MIINKISCLYINSNLILDIILFLEKRAVLHITSKNNGFAVAILFVDAIDLIFFFLFRQSDLLSKVHVAENHKPRS